MQRRRDKAAAVKPMRKLLKKQGSAPDVRVTDKLRSYGAASPKSGCRLAATRAYARTIGLRIRLRRHDGASARCSVSNRPDQLNASCPFTASSKIRSTSNAISHPAARSPSSEKKLSGRGELLPQPEPEFGTSNLRARQIWFAEQRPEPRYFSIPSIELGAEILGNRALNCWPWRDH